MNRSETVLCLRHGGNIQLYDKERKQIVQFQRNKKETKFICWQKWVKAPGATHSHRWVNHNLYLSLKEVMTIRQDIINRNKALQPA